MAPLSRSSKTRIKTLCEDTISANSRFFDNIQDVPRQALTVGIQTVMNANEVIMMATGRSKAVALKQCIEGSISSSFTCTAIQNHEKAIVISDELATDELTVKTMKYYKIVFIFSFFSFFYMQSQVVFNEAPMDRQLYGRNIQSNYGLINIDGHLIRFQKKVMLCLGEGNLVSV